VACLMTPASWGPEKGRKASKKTDGFAKEMNRGRCADTWVSPHIHILASTHMHDGCQYKAVHCNVHSSYLILFSIF